MSADKPKDDLIGKTLGQYEIQQEIGRGGMATVYRARQRSMNRVVAVKVLPRHLLHDPGFFERFEREVDVIAHLEHPHILPIYDFGQEDGVPFIAMRYLGGGSLEQRIRRGLPPLEDLEKPLRQIAQALDYAHQQGIIHRDLKPGNIMLDEAGNAYLSDFGIARVLGSDLTGSMIIGTPAYMSPEQANGLPIDGRSDIYALGIVLFELITGREPYSAETPMAVLLKHINEPVPPVSGFREDVPQAVEDVIARATAKDPNDRYSSAGDMASAFVAALHGNPLTDTARVAPAAPPIASVATQPLPPAPSGTMPAPAAPAAAVLPSDTRMNGTLIGAAVVIVLVMVAAVAGVFVIRGQNNLDQSPTPVAQAMPTPFFQADRLQDDLYSISVPRAWIPPQRFYDLSDLNRVIHVWQAQDDTAYVALELYQVEMRDETSFQAAVENYERIYTTPLDTLTFLDEEVAPDGTIRRSYRMVGTAENNHRFPPGQLDIYYLNRSPYLVALNMYSADSTGNSLVQTFQQILDSLRINTTGTT